MTGAGEAIARRLQEEAETAQALATLSKEQADAIRPMLDADIKTELAARAKDVTKGVRNRRLLRPELNTQTNEAAANRRFRW